MLARHKICGSHTAENICDCFEDIVASYKLSDKFHIIVTDNATNIVKVFCLDLSVMTMVVRWPYITREMDYYTCHYRGYHVLLTLQLVVNDGLQDLGPEARGP